MKKNILVLIGGNSGLVQEILQMPLSNYDEVIVICHRKYFGKNRGRIIEHVNPFLFDETIIKVFHNPNIMFDVIVSCTPPVTSDYSDPLVREWGFTGLKLMNSLHHYENVNRFIYTGSCLSLIPYYHSSFYKRIKNLELQMFKSLTFCKKNKGLFAFLPPLDNQKGLLSKIFSEGKQEWSIKLVNELQKENRFLFPSGIKGVLMKSLFFFIK